MRIFVGLWISIFIFLSCGNKKEIKQTSEIDNNGFLKLNLDSLINTNQIDSMLIDVNNENVNYDSIANKYKEAINKLYSINEYELSKSTIDTIYSNNIKRYLDLDKKDYEKNIRNKVQLLSSLYGKNYRDNKTFSRSKYYNYYLYKNKLIEMGVFTKILRKNITRWREIGADSSINMIPIDSLSILSKEGKYPYK